MDPENRCTAEAALSYNYFKSYVMTRPPQSPTISDGNRSQIGQLPLNHTNRGTINNSRLSQHNNHKHNGHSSMASHANEAFRRDNNQSRNNNTNSRNSNYHPNGLYKTKIAKPKQPKRQPSIENFSKQHISLNQHFSHSNVYSPYSHLPQIKPTQILDHNSNNLITATNNNLTASLQHSNGSQSPALSNHSKNGGGHSITPPSNNSNSKPKRKFESMKMGTWRVDKLPYL